MELELELERRDERALSDTLLQLTWERQGPQLQPLNAAEGVNLIRVDGVLACPQLPAMAPALQKPEQAGFRTLISHPFGVSIWEGIDPAAPLALQRLGAGPVLVQLFLRGNPFRAGRERQEPWGAALSQLQAAKRLAGLVVYGSPYAWESLRANLNPSIPAAYCPGQMPEAQEMVLQGLINSTRADSADPNGPGEGFTD